MPNKNNILFSIIIPTFNRAYIIETAIKSVINQSYTNWELIIIDDGSTDNTKEIVARFEEKRINYIYTKNNGRSNARNLGIERAKGDYICFLDDDDFYYNDFLQEFYNEIIAKNNAIGIYMCNQDEETRSREIIKGKTIDFSRDKLRVLFEYSNNFQPFCTSKEIFKKEKFNPNFELGEDFNLLFRVMLQFPLFYIPKSLCVYKIHDEMTMEQESKNELFIKLPYNRLDSLEDLFSNYSKLIKNNKAEKLLSNRYNKVLYFYSSMALKANKYDFSFQLLKKLKLKGDLLKSSYYVLSIIFRIPFYFITSIKKDN